MTNKPKKIRVQRKLFTLEEDQKLIELVEKYKDDWGKISSEMKNRSVRQCKERYLHYLSPNIIKRDWTPEEDMLLLFNIQKYGKAWKKLEILFPGRTEIDIRNRFNILFRRIVKISLVSVPKIKKM